MTMLLAALLAAAPAAGPVAGARMVDTPVLTHAVARGGMLTREDFAVEARPPAAARAAMAPAQADGMQATRNLMAGAPVRQGDLVRPQQVRRGETVEIALRNGALSIITSGRALSGGATGEPVRVVSAGTSRTLDAIVEGAGRVRVNGQ